MMTFFMILAFSLVQCGSYPSIDKLRVEPEEGYIINFEQFQAELTEMFYNDKNSEAL